MKLCRSTRVLFGSISLAITVYQESAVSYQPRFLIASEVLLMYTHSFFSSSVYCVASSIFRVGD